MQKQPLAEWWKLWLRGGQSDTSHSGISTEICAFSTVEDFWRIFIHLRPLRELGDRVCGIEFFKDGIQPNEADSQTSGGGQWIVRIKRSGELQTLSNPSDFDRYSLDYHLSRVALAWESLVLCVIGGEFARDKVFSAEEVLGLAFSVFPDEYWISLWNRTALSPTVVNALQDSLHQVLDAHLGPAFSVDYEYLPLLESLGEHHKRHGNRHHKAS